jgi:signal transduction histidine kinase
MQAQSAIDVLLVDDSGFFRTVVSDRLGKNDRLSVRKASDGAAALSALDEDPADCVVSDFRMPGMNGLELYERVDAEYGLPFVLLTGEGDESTASRAIGSGIDDYLRKDEVAESDRLELLANRIENVLPTETAAGRLEHGRRAITAGSAVTFQDGYGVRHFHNVAAPVTTGGDADSFQLITRDITQQKRREQQLEAKTEELAVINRLVRHDINNDVQLLLGWADGVRDHTDDAGQDRLDRIQETCKHISELTTIARDFVESIGGDAEFENESVNLAHILDNELDKADRRYEDATITVDGTVPSVAVRGNELLSSVFSNLLTNAVRHNDGPEPHVEVAVETRDTDVVVRIADDGPGIPDSAKESVFGKGQQGLDSPGTGIGLYLVHTLVDRYGGQVRAEDSDPTGTVLVVELQRS